MKTGQELLGHASYRLTANTYTSILPEYARSAAENAASLSPADQRVADIGQASDAVSHGAACSRCCDHADLTVGTNTETVKLPPTGR